MERESFKSWCAFLVFGFHQFCRTISHFNKCVGHLFYLFWSQCDSSRYSIVRYIYISDIYLWSTSLDLWPPDHTYLWLSSIGYSGAFKLDQSDEQRKPFCQWCVSIWISLYGILSACGFWIWYVCDFVCILSCTGILYSYSTSCYAEAVMQIFISAICRDNGLYTGKLLGKTDL